MVEDPYRRLLEARHRQTVDELDAELADEYRRAKLSLRTNAIALGFDLEDRHGLPDEVRSRIMALVDYAIELTE